MNRVIRTTVNSHISDESVTGCCTIRIATETNQWFIKRFLDTHSCVSHRLFNHLQCTLDNTGVLHYWNDRFIIIIIIIVFRYLKLRILDMISGTGFKLVQWCCSLEWSSDKHFRPIWITVRKKSKLQYSVKKTMMPRRYLSFVWLDNQNLKAIGHLLTSKHHRFLFLVSNVFWEKNQFGDSST